MFLEGLYHAARSKFSSCRLYADASEECSSNHWRDSIPKTCKTSCCLSLMNTEIDAALTPQIERVQWRVYWGKPRVLSMRRYRDWLADCRLVEWRSCLTEYIAERNL